MAFDDSPSQSDAPKYGTRRSSASSDSLGPVSPEYGYGVPPVPPPTLGPPPAAGAPPPIVVVEAERATTDKPARETSKQGLSAFREIVETLLLAFLIFVAVRA